MPKAVSISLASATSSQGTGVSRQEKKENVFHVKSFPRVNKIAHRILKKSPPDQQNYAFRQGCGCKAAEDTIRSCFRCRADYRALVSKSCDSRGKVYPCARASRRQPRRRNHA